jgi:hypothetical protein
MTKIPLPSVSKSSDSSAHAFPFQVGLQAQEFIQGTMYYVAFQDIAAGEFVRLHDGTGQVEALMLVHGLNKDASDQAWKILGKYLDVFKSSALQNVLISFCSHWDWYIRKISDFIQNTYFEVFHTALSNSDIKQLERADHLSLPDQIHLIERLCKIDLETTELELNTLREMSLVRNIGLHNRWEIDSKYLSKSITKDFQLGHLRKIEISELTIWHSLLINIINKSSIAIAKKFNGARDFEI